MIIAISGTPGTGKTSVAKILAKKLKANLIEVGKLIGKEIPYKIDKQRKTKEVSMRDARKAVKNKITSGYNIIDSHYSHMLKPDVVIVLRTNPKELMSRLKRKKWPYKKIRENIKAEILDAATIEALEHSGCRKDVYEIDTSRKSAEKVASLITEILKKPSVRNKYVSGKIDWTKKYVKELIE